ncbi:MAG: hydroxymethylbilane synthase [Chloroflexi bacterium]|nr:hydroxymethylbilane synthase [Chloroflexota bacterium]MBM3172203.1 hydroxymethylbilane synthase [Chloroflexota bacterium]MBM3174195.1 hydroxymethylbilane synthase [Chloroflexota bacterium]MBM4450183.1 hydroxymethylbilane synthase [Chloroflexota bacterium]
MRRRIVIGTRGSKLAIIQAESVLKKLRLIAPDRRFSLMKIATTGDKESNTPLDRLAGEGVFVKELEGALADGKIDMAVHSLKDLPIEIPQGLALGAATERLESRDTFISSKGKLAELPPGSIVGTGSHRRAIQVLAYRPDLKVQDLRGNIETRLRKLSENRYDGIIVAAAALIRLGLEKKITEYLPAEHFTPEVGQGALGIEIRTDDEDIRSLVSLLNHHPTWHCVTAERAFLKTLGGGCRAPITALGSISNNILKLDGMVASTHSTKILRCSLQGNARESERLGIRLAQKMIEMGALNLINEVRSRHP